MKDCDGLTITVICEPFIFLSNQEDNDGGRGCYPFEEKFDSEGLLELEAKLVIKRLRMVTGNKRDTR